MNNDSNSNLEPKTFYDSPERSSYDEILGEISNLRGNSLINQLLESFPESAFIINKHRQILAFNSKVSGKFKSDDYFKIIGNRFGEAIDCIHHAELEAGCGTSSFCRECGVAQAIRKSREEDIASKEECRITTYSDGKEISHNFYVHARPLRIADSIYTIVALRDISQEKWRDLLENIFFHDVLNTAEAVKGLSEILVGTEKDEYYGELSRSLYGSAKQLLNEIQAQRELRNAENGQLQPDFEVYKVNEILNSVYDVYKNHKLAATKYIGINKTEENTKILSDPTLVIRCLGNLVKNALEASDSEETVEVSACAFQNVIEFKVKNQKVIPDNIQLQLFQRSFSTKRGKGRGIGLYSVKLIVEQYLKGKVSFVSNVKEGTVFKIELPVNPEL